MKTSAPMTQTEAASYLRTQMYFPTLRAATSFLHDVRDDERVRSPGTGDREGFSVEYTAARRFIVRERYPSDEPGAHMMRSTRPLAGTRKPWADSEIPDGALDRALGNPESELNRLTAFYEAKGDDHYTARMSARQAMAADAESPARRTYILAADAFTEPVSGRMQRKILESADGTNRKIILDVGNDDAVDVLGALRRAYENGREDRAAATTIAREIPPA